MSKTGKLKLLLALIVISLIAMSQTTTADFGFGGGSRAKDPGVRGGPAGAGQPFSTLSPEELAMFVQGRADFLSNEDIGDGVGPRFNAPGCGFCHSQPDTGGTSPALNPLFDLFKPPFNFAGPPVNNIPSFIDKDGPIREARFQFNSDGSRDGGVHNLFVITGHPDAGGCNIRQEDFERQVRNRNIIFRIPSPVFGAGLIEQIKDSAILANLAADSSKKRDFGISGKVNRNGNDGTITRFGWKAQNKSLQIFSGEAYNVEMGITNESFQQEREEDPNCQFARVPNDVTTDVGTLNAIDNFANFQRFLAPPTPASNGFGNVSKASIDRGRGKFTDVGCALCHTPTLRTPADNPSSGTGGSTVFALRNQSANLFSDLALHNMGDGLKDDIIQGLAQGNEFRTAPLWGIGQRVFFLHDGRTTDLYDAIQEHKSNGSEANKVIDNFNGLGDSSQQDILNFLRSL